MASGKNNIQILSQRSRASLPELCTNMVSFHALKDLIIFWYDQYVILKNTTYQEENKIVCILFERLL